MPKTAKAAPKWANPKAADAAPAKGNAGESVAKNTNKDNSDSVNARGALSGKIRLKNGGNTNKVFFIAFFIAQIAAKGYLRACNWFLFFMFFYFVPVSLCIFCFVQLQ